MATDAAGRTPLLLAAGLWPPGDTADFLADDLKTRLAAVRLRSATEDDDEEVRRATAGMGPPPAPPVRNRAGRPL